MMWHHFGFGLMGGYGWLGIVFWCVVMVLMVVVVVFAIRYLSRHGRSHAGASDESPEIILKRRYARGEINKDEFDRIRKDLQ